MTIIGYLGYGYFYSNFIYITYRCVDLFGVCEFLAYIIDIC